MTGRNVNHKRFFTDVKNLQSVEVSCWSWCRNDGGKNSCFFVRISGSVLCSHENALIYSTKYQQETWKSCHQSQAPNSSVFSNLQLLPLTLHVQEVDCHLHGVVKWLKLTVSWPGRISAVCVIAHQCIRLFDSERSLFIYPAILLTNS